MRKLLICALALGGFAASAQAADLSVDSLKDPLPEGPLTYKGVTFYGTIDVGYAYQTEGAPYNGSMYTGLGYVVQKDARGAVSSLTNNAFSQSGVGAKIEENLGMGFVAISKLDTGFTPPRVRFRTLAPAWSRITVKRFRRRNCNRRRPLRSGVE